MIYKILIAIMLLNLSLFSQQALLFKSPPGNITLPSVMLEDNGIPKTNGMGIMESKWISSSSANAEELLQSFSTSSDIGIRKMINDILINASIPEDKISKIKVNFISSGIEERGINKEDVIFSDDFAVKYPQDNMLLLTKLYRTKNVKIELTEEGAAEFDPVIKNAISEGLRFGNKTESTNENKMMIEIASLVFAYENVPMSISRLAEKSLVVPEYFASDVGINSIGSMTVTEYGPNDYFVKVVSPAAQKPVEFKISSANPTANFKVGGRESYAIKYIEISGNKVTFTISGYMVSFP
jgi:hypothetical protein